MNKKNIVTEKNIKKIADFLQEACEYFKKNPDSCCCYHFPLSEDLSLYVGWSDGYDMADTDIIKSQGDRPDNKNGWTCGWAVNAAVKVRNDCDDSDFDWLDYPFYEDGECWDNGITMRPDQSRRDYRNDAKWFLKTFVAMTNAHAKGELRYE